MLNRRLVKWLSDTPGVQLVFSSAEKGLWYDHDERSSEEEKGWGIFIKFRAGRVYRPITRPSRIKKSPRHKWNDFNTQDHLLLKFTMPIPILPFISISFGRFGFYFGFKQFNAFKSKYHENGDSGFVEAPWQDGFALSPSITTRRTRAT